MREPDINKAYDLSELTNEQWEILIPMFQKTSKNKLKYERLSVYLRFNLSIIIFENGDWLLVGLDENQKVSNAKELFGERLPEVGQTKEEALSNQVSDDSKLVKKHTEQNLEMIDSKSKNNFKDITDSISDLLEYKNEKYGNTILEPLNIFSGKSKAGHEIDKKLSRVKNSKKLRKNDVVDIIGYLVLTCREFDWNNFDEFKD